MPSLLANFAKRSTPYKNRFTELVRRQLPTLSCPSRKAAIGQIGSLLAVAVIFATLITLGGSIDSTFDALQNWKAITLDIVLVTFLFAEFVLFWIMVTGMIRRLDRPYLSSLRCCGREIAEFIVTSWPYTWLANRSCHSAGSSLVS